MGTFQSFRKAYGAIKDSTTVGLAKVNSEFKELDVAVVKATNHVEAPPKERHVRKIFSATSVVRPRADVAYCIHALARRLSRTRNWIVAIKVLIVIHRTLREGDPTFKEELMTYSHKGHILQISNFKDDSSPLAWDCAAWVRTYAMFLEERLECFRILKYDIEAERLTRSSPGATKVHSRTRLLGAMELLEQLPALQQLLYRLMGCQPEGAACTNYLVQYALALVLKESFKIYCAINDGIINLVDAFFDMPKHDAVKALNIYKRAGQQADFLSDFYDFCKHLELARNFQFPTLRQPPSSFLSTMEEYVREAPQITSVSQGRLEYEVRDVSSERSEETASPGETHHPSEELEEDREAEERQEVEEEQQCMAECDQPPPAFISTDSDLLGLNEINPRAVELEESNALALAIVPNGNVQQCSHRGLEDLVGTSGWELALVSTPGNDISQPPENNFGGGFDKLLLDSLYDDEAARRQIQLTNAGYGSSYNGMGGGGVHNPFEQQNDPFIMSSGFAPPSNVQMAAALAQQHQMFGQSQPSSSNDMMMVPYSNVQTHPVSSFSYYPITQQTQSHFNPFGDPFVSQQQTAFPQHGGNQAAALL